MRKSQSEHGKLFPEVGVRRMAQKSMRLQEIVGIERWGWQEFVEPGAVGKVER